MPRLYSRSAPRALSKVRARIELRVRVRLSRVSSRPAWGTLPGVRALCGIPFTGTISAMGRLAPAKSLTSAID
eukprot:scaffold40774_cov72-Phaeocystis_antarctica.AAC.13